jgi:DNA-binding Lrp family transcriptional regulator
MKAIVLMTVSTGEIHAVVRDIRRLKSVQEVYSAFGPYDVIAIVEANDLSRLGAIVSGDIQPIPGVEKTITCLAVEPEMIE